MPYIETSARMRRGATVEARHPGRASWGEFPTSISDGQKVASTAVLHYKLSSRKTMSLCVVSVCLFLFCIYYYCCSCCSYCYCYYYYYFVAKQIETFSGIAEVKSLFRILWS